MRKLLQYFCTFDTTGAIQKVHTMLWEGQICLGLTVDMKLIVKRRRR